MATAFDEERLTVSGSGIRVAGNVNFDSGVWRGVFTASRTGVLAYQIAREGCRRPAHLVRLLGAPDLDGRRAGRVVRACGSLPTGAGLR